jgi:hypothetical protein
MIPGVGKAIARKIWEIIETGQLKKLDSLKKRDDLGPLKLFTNIHGVGPITAQSFIQQVYIYIYMVVFFCYFLIYTPNFERGEGLGVYTRTYTKLGVNWG